MDKQRSCLNFIVADTVNLASSIAQLTHLKTCADGITELQKVSRKLNLIRHNQNNLPQPDICFVLRWLS